MQPEHQTTNARGVGFSEWLAAYWPYALIGVCGATCYLVFGNQNFWLLFLAQGVGYGWGFLFGRSIYKGRMT